MEFLKNSEEILGVGEFSRRFKMLVKTAVPELWLRGEVSNLKTYSSGHVYFTLKDEEGAISAVLFKGYSRAVSFPLREGMKILAYGEISVYEARGSYQIVVKAALPDGTGDLARRFEELKKKLSDEGLFDASKKKDIPALPKNIGVVTSPTGAAIRDFCRILLRRGWRGNVFVLPSRVQGAEAAREIVGQLEFAQNHKFESGEGFDLLVVMRGGGSLEDLWPFNEEIVARAVAECSIPVISAVGHEIDFTLSDFAADLRAETPSAAAEYISSAYIEAFNSVRETFGGIARIVDFTMKSLREKLSNAENVLRLNSPKAVVQNYMLKLDEMESRLSAAFSMGLSEKRHGLSPLSERLAKISPENAINLYKGRLGALEKQLELLGIDSALNRGFALATDKAGNFISSAEKVPQNGAFSLRFHDGSVEVKR